MQSQAKTVASYLAGLPAERREAIAAVRAMVRANVDPLVEEGMQYGMIGFYVPHRVYPAGYHVNPALPLPFIALASQKNHMALYLMTVYADGDGERWFRDEWAASGKKLDMGKSCLRFRTIDDLAMEVLAKAIKRTSVKDHIAQYELSLAGRGKAKAVKKANSGSRTTPAKKAKRPAVETEKAAAARRPAAKSNRTAAPAKKR